ncbi:MAG: DUF2141 domain-containing protein [Rhodospirillaceae bacterium]|nr:DUF2141 domain-containing protein [Rhodospirillaceae bacterium]
MARVGAGQAIVVGFAIVWLAVFTAIASADDRDIAATGGASHVEARALCATGAVRVNVAGFKDRRGNLRIEVYSDRPEDFLASRRVLQAAGRFFERVDFTLPPDGDVSACVALPAAGRYSMAVLHDRNADGKLDVVGDGYGFPNNPRLGLKKPAVETAAFELTDAPLTLDIVLNYWSGLGAGPLNKPTQRAARPQ